MEHKIIHGPADIQCTHETSAYLPFTGSGFHNSYYRIGEFNFDILTQHGGTCGPPAVSSGETTAAFLTERGGRIRSDGETIHIHIPEGQKLLLVTGGGETKQWALYSELVELPDVKTVMRQDFWMLPEYVTWVEQKAQAEHSDRSTVMILDEALVMDFLARINSMELPPGKLTIDDGWQQRLGEKEWTDGYWKVDTTKFPDMQGLCHKIQDEGFVPSLWMGIPGVPLNAPIIRERPELFDEKIQSCPLMKDWGYYKPGQALSEHFAQVLTPHVKMGFRKFKFDFFYGPRKRMREIMQCLHHVVRSLDPSIEIESHHSDPFFSCWLDVFRMNDVLIRPGYDWRGLTLSHLHLGLYNPLKNILNLDHAGGNFPGVAEEEYIEHIHLFDAVPDIPRYPVLSLLPDRFSQKAVTCVKEHLERHVCKVSEL